MKRSIVFISVALVTFLGVWRRARAQTGQAFSPNMAPLDQYLMDDADVEIALAWSAAPESISRDATVLVLGRRGYEKAIEGKNGFVCVVERSWTSAFDATEYWNPKILAPICFNPAAARSILPLTVKRTQLALAGASKSKMNESIKAALESKEVPPLEPGAMAYMMSNLPFQFDSKGHWTPHLMFYVPQTDPATWGSDFPGSPVLHLPRAQGAPEPITAFMVPVGTWSDGTALVLKYGKSE